MNKPWKDVTIYDIAEKLNLSASTVSRALNNHPIIKEKTRKLVQLTAKEMNFEFNIVQNSQPCGTRRTTIGVILPFLNKENMADMVAGMIEMSDQLGFDVILAQSLGLIAKEIELTREMLKRKVDGLLICLAHEKAEMNHFSKFQKHNIPICSFYSVWNHPYSSQVYINDFRAAHDLTMHLLNEGCEHIAYVTSHTSNNIHQHRLEGYKEALVERRVQFDEKLVFNSDLSVAAGEKVAKQIFELRKMPDAVIVTDDICAVSCMNTLKNLGVKFPNDMLVAGFNNHVVSAMSDPALTTIEIPAYQMGQVALTQLVNQIRSKGTATQHPFRICLEHRLVLRTSSLRLGYENKISDTLIC